MSMLHCCCCCSCSSFKVKQIIIAVTAAAGAVTECPEYLCEDAVTGSQHSKMLSRLTIKAMDDEANTSISSFQHHFLKASIEPTG